jgi:hypothetical protein
MDAEGNNHDSISPQERKIATQEDQIIAILKFVLGIQIYEIYSEILDAKKIMNFAYNNNKTANILHLCEHIAYALIQASYQNPTTIHGSLEYIRNKVKNDSKIDLNKAAFNKGIMDSIEIRPELYKLAVEYLRIVQ